MTQARINHIFNQFSSLAFVMLAAMTLLEIGCNTYPAANDQINDFDIVYTSYDEAVNFSLYTTYALPSKIIMINEDTSNATYLEDENPEQAQLIRSSVERKMQEKGYTLIQIDSSNIPDLILNVGILNAEVQGVYADDCSWYNYPYYWNWYPNWGWEIGWTWDSYPCWGYDYYSYNVGSLTMDLVDVDATIVDACANSNSCTLAVIWKGIVRGLLEGEQNDLNERIQNGVEQAFDQSTYLKK